MSVLGYLQKRASDGVLSATEKTSINTSIATLKNRLGYQFPTGLKEQLRFGSSTRDTILPRSMDERSDIDYMIVFSDGGYTPQTYLDRLKRFVTTYYPSSEIYQSSPTIVLELNHIKFDLVPALAGLWAGYQIPDGSGGWQSTNPNDFNQTLETANKNNLYLLKPTIRLAKFWNAKNNYIFDSFLFEKWIVGQSYYTAINQRDYLFAVIDAMSTYNITEQWRRDKIERAKKLVNETRTLEKNNYPNLAEAEVKKLIPE